VDEQAPPVDLDAVLAELKARVAARREAGEYPEALEAELAEHFERVMGFRRPDPLPEETYLSELVAQLHERSRFGLHRVRYDSSLPGGEALHRTIGRIVARQNAGVLEQLQHYANLINEMLRILSHLAQEPPYHFHDDLWRHLDGMLQRMADAERVEAGGPIAIAALVERVAALEAEVAGLRADGDG
jgi:hypothetical protein